MSLIRQWMGIGILALSLGFATGCGGTRIVLVPPGEPVQLAEDTRAFVYVQVEGKRIKSPNRVMLPMGWWCLPDPE